MNKKQGKFLLEKNRIKTRVQFLKKNRRICQRASATEKLRI